MARTFFAASSVRVAFTLRITATYHSSIGPFVPPVATFQAALFLLVTLTSTCIPISLFRALVMFAYDAGGVGFRFHR